MSLRNLLVKCATVLIATAFVTLPVAAAKKARKAQPEAAPALTAETLVPSELFPEAGGKNFGYPNGFTVTYMQTDGGHRWKLAEKAAAFATPTPTPAGSPGAETAAPTPSPAGTPAAQLLPETADEVEFDSEVEMLGPTFVTLVFAESPAAASDMVTSFFEQHKDWMKEDAKEKLPHPNLAVFKIERDAAPAKGAVIYNREFNLGEKQGGFRRASSVLLSSGRVFLRVDARKGLSDTEYDGSEATLEKRARQVATYLLKKL